MLETAMALAILSFPALALVLAFLNIEGGPIRDALMAVIVASSGLLAMLVFGSGIMTEVGKDLATFASATMVVASWWVVALKLRLLTQPISRESVPAFGWSWNKVSPKAVVIFGILLTAGTIAILTRYEFYSGKGSSYVEVRDRWTGEVFRKVPSLKR